MSLNGSVLVEVVQRQCKEQNVKGHVKNGDIENGAVSEQGLHNRISHKNIVGKNEHAHVGAAQMGRGTHDFRDNPRKNNVKQIGENTGTEND